MLWCPVTQCLKIVESFLANELSCINNYVQPVVKSCCFLTSRVD